MSGSRWITLPAAPQLRDGHGLILRLPVAADADGIVAYAIDPEVVRWTTIPVPYNVSDAYEFISSVAAGWRDSQAAFAIDYHGRYAGGVDLRFGESGHASVGYGLAPWARGRGIMTRALRVALAWGFEFPNLDVVHWSAVEGNWASRRVAQRCGFRMDGTVTGGAERRGFRRDAWTGSLRRGEPLTGRQV